jgi:predicted RNase H-like HicB family nuclease
MEANGTYTFTMLFEPEEEGGYVVTCPALPGLVTEGDTMAEARQMAEDALRGYHVEQVSERDGSRDFCGRGQETISNS